MTRNEKLRAEADDRRKEFFRTAYALREQGRPLAVVDNLVKSFDPHFEILSRIVSRTRQNPVAVLLAVGSLWLLTRHQHPGAQSTRAATRRNASNNRITRSSRKGDENGYSNDTEHR